MLLKKREKLFSDVLEHYTSEKIYTKRMEWMVYSTKVGSYRGQYRERERKREIAM